MKNAILYLAIAFASQPVLAQVVDPERVDIFGVNIEFVVTDVRTTLEDPALPARGQLGSVEPAGSGLDPLVEPTSSLYTVHYQIRGDWEIPPWHGTLSGPGVRLSVTNDHPAWDALTYSSGPASSRLGDWHMNTVSLVLADRTRSALSSTDLPTTLPFTAFTNGEIALRYGNLFRDGEALVLGRVTSVETNPDRDSYRCQGFEPPMHHPRRYKLNSGQRFNLRATLVDETGQAVGESGLASRPVLRVLQTEGPNSLRYVMDLPAAEVDFEFKGGRWVYSLQGLSLPEAGIYLVSMTSPDQNEYVIDSQCRMEITVE